MLFEKRGSALLASSLLVLLCVAGAVLASGPDAASAEPREHASQDVWWSNLQALCGDAYAGALVSTDEADAALAGQPMVMHVRRCAPDRIEIPFHIGENRSRTWVLTRTDNGIQLQHDHRHEDGSEDVVTLYGGTTAEAGTPVAQFFPADAYSKTLFEAQGLDVSVTNVWSMELVPGERFSYILRRPGRHFRADFDLRDTVAQPPAPWGHEE
ncbi:MAG: hypothetical protein AAGD38_22370 [Acidobacteriota bacterium]